MFSQGESTDLQGHLLCSHHFENPPLFSTFSIMLNGLTFMKLKSNR